MKSRSDSEWVKTYDTIHQELTVKGFKPKLQTLDNEASAALNNFFTANDVDYQLVPPHCHRRGTRHPDFVTAGLYHIESPADLDTAPTTIRRSPLLRPRGLQQNSLCSSRM
jgi:hypothetical protein